MDRRRTLRRLLTGYRPADAAEARHRREMLALLDLAGDPFTRKRFDPGHFTASGFVLAPDAGALLLVHHAGLGRWLQPGGHVESTDADLSEAARREIAEETGLQPGRGADRRAPQPFDLDVHPIPARNGEPAHLHFDVRFLFRTVESTPGRAAPREATRWVRSRELAAIAHVATTDRLLRKLARAGFCF